MKRTFVLILLVLLMIGTSACESSTEFGDCIGVNAPPEPNLVYKYSARNIIVGIIFIEMIAPPVLVVLNELQCPVRVKSN